MGERDGRRRERGDGARSRDPRAAVPRRARPAGHLARAETADRLGLDGAVVAAARARVSPERLRIAELLAESEAAERAAAEAREAAEAERREAEALAAQATAREAELHD